MTEVSTAELVEKLKRRQQMEKKRPELLYTVAEVAELLKTNETYVRKLIKKGLLKSMVLGRVKVRASAVDEFLEAYEGYDVTDVDNIKKIEITQ